MRALFAFGKFELPISYPWGPVLFETTERFDEERTQETQEQSGLKSAREVGHTKVSMASLSRSRSFLSFSH
jgi:hypothetical protein